jgi:hypothetical protein
VATNNGKIGMSFLAVATLPRRFFPIPPSLFFFCWIFLCVFTKVQDSSEVQVQDSFHFHSLEYFVVITSLGEARMADCPVIVTVESVCSSERDVKLRIPSGQTQTVMDVKHFISSQASHITPSEQCLLYEGRLLQDHEGVHDLIERYNDVSCSILLYVSMFA